MDLPRLHILFAVALWVASAGAVRAAGDSRDGTATFDIRWGDQPVAALRTHVAPSSSTRWCGTLRKGETVSWEFNSAEPLEMAVQAQEARNAVNLTKLDGVTDAKGTLAVDAEQVYCWTWTNRMLSPVALQARMSKMMR
jgi:hypothetical protein